MNKEKKIYYIALDRIRGCQYPVDMSAFRGNTRFISNYLSKAVRPLNLIGNGLYNMIGVKVTSDESKIGPLFNNSVQIYLHISNEEFVAYKSMTNLKDRYEFYLSCLERGYKLAATDYNIPVDELLKLHQQFRDGGYKNEWIWKKKPLKEYGLYLIFRCRFTTFDFTLSLEVYDLKKTHLITEGLITRRAPYEVSYDWVFSKIALSNKTTIENDIVYYSKMVKYHKIINIEKDTLYILNFLSKPTFAINLIKLQNGEFNVSYLLGVGRDDDAEKIKNLSW